MAINAASLIMNVSADTSAAERSLSNLQNRATGSFNSIRSSAQGVSGSLGSMFDVAGGVAFANMISSATNALQGLARTAMESYAFTERLNLSLTNMAGREMVKFGMAESMTELRQMPELMEMAAGRAEELQAWMEKLAIQSPFKYSDVADAMRLSMAYGFTSTQAQRMTKTLSDFAAGSGQTGYAIHRVALALGQIRSRGKVASQELNQLSEVGVNAREILADAFGKTVPEMMYEIEHGFVPANAAIEAIVSSLERDFGSAADAQAQSMSGLLMSLEDLQAFTARDLFSGVFQSIQPFMAELVATLTDPEVKAQIKQIGVDIGVHVTAALSAAKEAATDFYTEFERVGGGIRGVIAGIGAALQIPQWASGITSFVASWALLTPALAFSLRLITQVGAGFAGLFAAMTGPIGLAAASMTALFFAWETNFMGIREVMAPTIAMIENVAEAIGIVYDMVSTGFFNSDQIAALTEAFGTESANRIFLFADQLRGAVVAVNTFVQEMTSATGPIATTWTQLVTDISSIVSDLSDTFAEISEQFSVLFDSSMWKKLTTVAGAAALFIQQSFGRLFDGELTLTEFTARLGTALSTLASMVGEAIGSPELQELSRGLGAIIGLDDLSLDSIREGVQELVGTLAKNFTDMITSVDWGGMLGDLGGALTLIGGAIAQLIASIDWGAELYRYGYLWGSLTRELILSIINIDWGGLLTNAGRVFGGLVLGLLNVLSSVDWGGALQAYGNFYGGYVDALVEGLKTVDWGAHLSNAADWLGGLLDWIVGSLSTVDWGGMLSTAANFIAGIVTWISSQISALDWGAFFATMQEKLQVLVATIADAITTLDWGTIVSNAAGMLGGLLTAVMEAITTLDWGTIVANAGKMLAGLLAVITTLLGLINWGEIATNANTIFADFIANVIAGITSLDWGKIATDAVTIFTSFVTQVVAAVTSLDWGKITTDAATVFGSFVTTVAGAIQGIPWGDYIKATGETFGTLATSVRDALMALMGTDFMKEVMKSIDFRPDNAEFITQAIDAFDEMQTAFWDGVAAQIEAMDFTAIITGFLDGIAQSFAEADWSAAGASLAGAITGIFSGDSAKVELEESGNRFKEALIDGFTNIDWTDVKSSLAGIDAAFAEGMGAFGEGFGGNFEMPAWLTAAVDWFAQVPGWVDTLTNFKIEFTWPDLPTFTWPDLPTFSWPTLPTWTWPDIAPPSWLASLLGWSPSVTVTTQTVSPTTSTAGYEPYTPSETVQRIGGHGTRAKGGPAKGMTLVGEEGPELVFFGDAAHVLSNPDSLKFLEMMGIQAFADGTTRLPPLPPSSNLRLMPGAASGGRPAPPIGPSIDPTAIIAPIVGASESAWDNIESGWLGQLPGFVDDTTSAAAAAMESAGKATQTAFEKSAKATTTAFESALKSALQATPGLFGTSQVTEDQMRLAELGVPQNFADDWLRQLTDEVVNGVDWEGVDIKDAAARAGIDPNLPNEIILEMVKQMWADSSLFADPKNLELINMEAVGAQIAKQQAAAAGQANIMSLFGLGDETSAQGKAQAAANEMLAGFAEVLQGGAMNTIGEGTMVALASGMGKLTPEATAALSASMSKQMGAVSEIGTTEIADQLAGTIAGAISKSVSDSGAVSNFTNALSDDFGTQESITYLNDVGMKIAEYIFEGYKKGASEQPWATAIPAGGNASATTTAVATVPLVPGNAAGTSFWRGGMTLVGEQGPELVRLPMGARIYNANDSERMMGNGASDPVVIEEVHIHNNMEVSQLEYRIRQMQRRRGR